MNKIALITGASRGIGKGIAEVFANKGYNVALGYVQSANLTAKICDRLRKEYQIEAMPVQGDVVSYSKCQKMITQVIDVFGKIGILVNNAAQYAKNPTEEERARLALTKLNSVEFLSRLACERETESIVNISSMLTVNHRKSPFATAYQSAIESLTMYFAKEYSGKTRVNAVRPGICATDMVFDNYTPEEIELMLDSVPDKKLICPEEIGEVVYFLATNQLLTGQILTADKGTTLNGY